VATGSFPRFRWGTSAPGSVKSPSKGSGLVDQINSVAQFFNSISADIADFIRAQPVFFVATAPLAAEGHINVSPKGLDCLRILAPNRVAYLDLTGSGNETAAHVTENGRITLMFCAFEGKPNIVRLYGRGKAIQKDSGEWPALAEQFVLYPGTRQIIVCNIDRVQTSCGLAVPKMRFEEHRDGLLKWASAKGDEGLQTYRQTKNRHSIDGIPTPLA
jgi:Pyridoxamine 5'-phosphate oxidase